MMLVSAALNMPVNLETLAMAKGIGQFTFQFQRKAMSKNAQTNAVSLISHASKVMLKILKARLQQYISHELPDVPDGFRKGRGTRGQIATSVES